MEVFSDEMQGEESEWDGSAERLIMRVIR